jgi:hypothetical protein
MKLKHHRCSSRPAPAAVRELDRSVKAATLTALVSLSVLLVGCAHYQRTHFRVVDSVSGEPLPSARFTTQFSLGALQFGDLFRPEWTYAQNQEAQSDKEGLATLRVPMSRPSGIHPQDEAGTPIDPEDVVGALVTVTKEGYAPSKISHSNNKWREVGKSTSPTVPLIIKMTPNTEQTGCSEPRDGAPVDNRGSLTRGH